MLYAIFGFVIRETEKLKKIQRFYYGIDMVRPIV